MSLGVVGGTGDGAHCVGCGGEIPTPEGRPDVHCPSCGQLNFVGATGRRARGPSGNSLGLDPTRACLLGLIGLLIALLVWAASGGGAGRPARSSAGRVAVARRPSPRPAPATAARGVVTKAPSSRPKGPDGAWVETFEALGRRYGVAVVWDGAGLPAPSASGGRVEVDPAAEADLEAAAGAVETALGGRYDPPFVARAGLRRLVLVGRLAVDGRARDGHADVEAGTVYLDASRRGGLAWTFHHELYHLVEHATEAGPPGGADTRGLAADLWGAINDPSFRYGEGLAAGAGAAPAGFVSRRAMSGPEEDRAETFAAMVADPRAVARAARSDPRVAGKLNHVRDTVAEFAPGAPPWDAAQLVWSPPAAATPERREPARVPDRGPIATVPAPAAAPGPVDDNDPWPPFAGPLPSGPQRLAVENKGSRGMTVGVRSASRGVDLDIGPGGRRAVMLRPGPYRVVFRWDDEPGEVFQAEPDVVLRPGFAGVTLTLGQGSGGSNLGLKRVVRPPR